jgi:integrase
MSVKPLGDGRFLVEVDRPGVKRVRRKFKTRGEAEEFERRYLSEQAGVGTEKAVDRRRLAELIDLWDRYHGINLTYHDKRLRALRVICHDLGNPVAALLSAEAWVEYRYRRTVAGPPEQRITPRTFNNYQGFIAALYGRLRKLKIIDYECPIAGVDPIKIQERQLSYLSRDQVNLLLDCIASGCTNPSTWWVAQVCLRTGARWGEAEQLRRKQLHDGRVTFVFTKSKKTRTVPLDPAFFAQLLEYCRGVPPEDRIFTGCIGSFRRAVERSGLKLPSGQCSHILRHSFASYFVMGGGNILTLQKILGHADIKMTMIYAHLAPEHLRDAIALNPLAD